MAALAEEAYSLLSIRETPIRPITNFTLHAVLAAALAALAATAAAAGPSVSGEMFVKLPAGGSTDRLALQSLEWGSDGADGEQEMEPVQFRYFEAWTVEVEGSDDAEGGAAPLPQGSLTVRIKHPWPACRVGARYSELELSDSGMIYRLKDVTVSKCSAGPGGRVTFNYGKLG